MRILFLSPAYKPAYKVGGPVASTSALAEALVRGGHSVTVFTTNGNMGEDLDVETGVSHSIDGVDVRYFARREFVRALFPSIPYLSRSIGYLYAPDMWSALKRDISGFDVVHVSLPFIYPTLLGWRASRLFSKPLFYHQRGVLTPEHLAQKSLKKKVYFKLIEKRILRDATTLVALTRHEYDSYRALDVETACRIIPNGVSPAEFPGERSPEVEKRFAIDPAERFILFIARLLPRKGIDNLIDAFAIARRKGLNASLMLAGPDEYGFKSRWERKVREAGLEGKVSFPGAVNGDAKKALLARADLFCLPSEAEGFSVAVLEALASGTPVLISPGCHFPEVQDAGAGVVSDTSPEILAAALLKLFSVPERLSAMGSLGRKLAAEKFSWDRIALDHLDMYAEGISRYSSQHSKERE